MSDGAAAAAGAPPPGGAPGGVTQSDGKAPVQTPGEKKEPTLADELGTVLKKYGGLKYKSNGKEAAIDDPDKLIRRLQNIDGLEASANELVKLKGETQGHRELRERLKTEKNPRERVNLLRQLAGEEAGFDEAAEAAVLEKYEREKAKSALSPRERQLADQLEQERGAREKLERSQKDESDKQEKARLDAATTQLKQQLFAITANAFQKVGVKPEMADRYIPEVATYIRQAHQKGLDVSPEDIVEFVTNQRDGENTEWILAKSDEALLDMLEKAIDEKDGISRAKRLAGLMARRTLESLNKAPPTGTPSIIPAGPGGQQQTRKGADFQPSYWNTIERKK